MLIFKPMNKQLEMEKFIPKMSPEEFGQFVKEQFAIARPVIYYKRMVDGVGVGPKCTKITIAPWQLGHGEWVCKVNGVAGCVALSHLRFVEDEWVKTRCYPEIIQAIKTSPQTESKYNSNDGYLVQGGKKYTLKELVEEMENNTSIGIDIQNSLFKLTIDLLMRGKETLPMVDLGWEDAPPWAKWRTVDADGVITHWENKPDKGKAGWVLSDKKGQYICKHGVNAHWDNTLEERPC